MSFIHETDPLDFVNGFVAGFILVVLGVLIAGASPNFSLTASPNVVTVGGSVNLSCRVPKHPDNRSISLGLENYTTSTRQLDGEQSPSIFTLKVDHIPCDAGPAFCTVAGVGGRIKSVGANLLVNCN